MADGTRERFRYAWRLAKPQVKRPREIVSGVCAAALVLIGTAVFSHASALVLAAVTIGGGALGAAIPPAWTFVSAYVTEPRRTMAERIERLERNGRRVTANPAAQDIKVLLTEANLLYLRLGTTRSATPMRPDIADWEDRADRVLREWPEFAAHTDTLQRAASAREYTGIRAAIDGRRRALEIVLKHLEGDA